MQFVYINKRVGTYIDGEISYLDERECTKTLGEAIVSRLNELDLPYHAQSYPTLLKFAIAIAHKIPANRLDEYLKDCNY